MKRIYKNKLLIHAILIFGTYWAVAFVSPNPYVSSAMSLLSLMAGFLMFGRYVSTSYDILINGERSEVGSHYAILGATTVAAGLIYSGMFSLMWIYFQQPPHWTGTAVSSFGRGMIALGLWLMAISPDSLSHGAKFPNGFWRATLVVMAIIIAFVAGTHFADLQ